MNKLATAIAAIALVGTPAFAADMAVKMPVKAPPPPPEPLFSWTGFYAGAELGAKWADSTWTTTSIIQTRPFPLDATSPRNFDPSGIRGGIYLGYNWQFAPQWVGGIELDWADANKNTTTVGIPGCSSSSSCNPFLGESIQGDAASVKMGWDASARARVGFLLSPGLLVYGAGGIAWQRVETSATCQFSLPDPICFGIPGAPFATVTDSTTRTGWTIGGGLEARIYGNWLLRGEYRYSDFGTWSNSFNLNFPGAFGQTFVNSQLRITTQIATVGIAYKFGP